MDGTRRTTHKLRYRDARRLTRRQQHQWHQSGGAAWPGIDAEFATALTAKGFGHLDLAGKAPPADEKTKREHLLEFFKRIGKQDEIFKAVYEIILKNVKGPISSVDVSDPSTIVLSADGVNAYKAVNMKYITEAEQLIAFVPQTTVGAGGRGDTKLHEIRTSSDLSTLLLFPAKLSNLLIMALTNIYVSLAEDSSKLLAVSTEAAKAILSTQYESYSQALAYTLTAMPLRDGFYLGQSIADFKKEVESDVATPFAAGKKGYFWRRFVNRLYENKAITSVDELFTTKGAVVAARTRNLATRSWGGIAADVFKYVDLKRDGDVLDLLALFRGARAAGEEDPRIAALRAEVAKAQAAVDALPAAALPAAALPAAALPAAASTVSSKGRATKPKTPGDPAAAARADLAAAQTALTAAEAALAAAPADFLRELNTNLPDIATYGNVPLRDGEADFTLNNILQKMDPTQLEFIVHLYTSIKQALAPATTPGSGEPKA